MMSRPSRAPGARSPYEGETDEKLVRACLDGNEAAWAALIDRYKSLIYSIPVRYHFSPEDCADIFQMVCLELFSELPRLRKPGALRAWIVSVAAHTSFHWKKRTARRAERERTDIDEDAIPDPAVTPMLLEELEQEQLVRDALATLPPRCREMIRLLFYEHPPLPYKEVAARLGLATGSIGFIRGRCLKRLAKALDP
jgi:RNA polymerase sigma factor (sigma-70 family)